MTVATDKPTYSPTESITVSGNATPVAEGYDVTVIIKKPDGSQWSTSKTTPTSTGTWSISKINTVSTTDPTGNYTVTATYRGKTATTTFTVTSGDTATSGSRISGPYPPNPKVGQAIGFESVVSGQKAPYDYLWDFGDGKKSVYQNPVWYPQSAGAYTVKLEVTDATGRKTTASLTVTVSP